MKIISGAQTGADLAGLDAAKAVGFATGGTMPKGYKDLDGNKPHYADLYNIGTTATNAYPPRTKKNIADADATMILATNLNSAGTKLTIKLCKALHKPMLIIDLNDESDMAQIVGWLKQYRTVNIAGNSEKSSPGIYNTCYELLLSAFTAVIREAGH